MKSIMFMYVPLMIALVLMVGEADAGYFCSDDLEPCYGSHDSDETPSVDCCNSMREATGNQFICLCNLVNSSDSILWMNFTQAPSLRRRCNLEDLNPSDCIGTHTIIISYVGPTLSKCLICDSKIY